MEDPRILEAWKRFINQRFLEWQSIYGERKTVTEFAEYLQYPQGTVSFWLNGERTPKKAYDLDRLSRYFGLIVYDILEKTRPDEDLHIVKSVWEKLAPEKRRALREQAEKYAAKK